MTQCATNGKQPDRHGLIYTDHGFLSQFRGALVLAGFDGLETCDVGYSEQGMQGEDFVSMDVGSEFLRAWTRVVGAL